MDCCNLTSLHIIWWPHCWRQSTTGSQQFNGKNQSYCAFRNKQWQASIDVQHIDFIHEYKKNVRHYYWIRHHFIFQFQHIYSSNQWSHVGWLDEMHRHIPLYHPTKLPTLFRTGHALCIICHNNSRHTCLSLNH